MKEYKVLTQRDKFWGGQFDPAKLEAAMNSFAAEGWTVISVATASVIALGGERDEIIIILEREK
ncbi:MAG: DUF4177 domain-containing protein [Candidatus Omnitrophica bacterium]|nr:DUF4177 domain-containing protein [Candidatus Omnitrophota bacterium]